MEENLHIEEFKVRLKPADAALLRALAGKRDVPPAVLARAIIVAALEPAAPRVAGGPDNRRPA